MPTNPPRLDMRIRFGRAATVYRVVEIQRHMDGDVAWVVMRSEAGRRRAVCHAEWYMLRPVEVPDAS